MALWQQAGDGVFILLGHKKKAKSVLIQGQVQEIEFIFLFASCSLFTAKVAVTTEMIFILNKDSFLISKNVYLIHNF